uniref:Fucosyltransferase n=1 Tax=Globodera pallida TaxID=36090 RepID=A0A183CNR7_GLOPA
ESSASLIVFHIGQSVQQWPQHRRPEQSPVWTSQYLDTAVRPNNYFNASIAYHSESTIYIPYEQFTPITAQTPPEEIWSEEEIRRQLSLKKRLALQLVSNCNAPSGRDVLTKQLQKLMELDVFGRCNGKPCDQKCFQQEFDSHFFYMAFENAVCPQYVTEKFWNALHHLVVPVVLSRSVLNGTGIPDDVYIAADDFGSAEGLAEHLKTLQMDTAKFLSYFNWTKKYRKHWEHNEPTALCQLCEIAHKQLRKDEFSTYTVQMDKFWTKKECQKDFARDVLFKRNDGQKAKCRRV